MSPVTQVCGECLSMAREVCRTPTGRKHEGHGEKKEAGRETGTRRLRQQEKTWYGAGRQYIEAGVHRCVGHPARRYNGEVVAEVWCCVHSICRRGQTEGMGNEAIEGPSAHRKAGLWNQTNAQRTRVHQRPAVHNGHAGQR